MDLSENCELNEDLVIEQKFFTLVPYDSDDSDYEWYLKNEDSQTLGRVGSSNTQIALEETSTPFQQDHTPKRSSRWDVSIDRSETSIDEDSRSILRNHRTVIAASTSGMFEASDVTTPDKPTTYNVRHSYPRHKHFTDMTNGLPPYVTPHRQRSKVSFSSPIHCDTYFSSHAHPVPTYKNYQLLGDSQLLRFSEQILSLRSYVTYDGEDSKTRFHGYCVSGQRIDELEARLLKREHKLSDKVIVLIGTNDFLQNIDYESMCASYSAIVQYLKQYVENMILLTVPPIPKIAKQTMYLSKLRKFNNYIKKLSDGPMITILDIAQAFIGYDNSTLDEYFEQYYDNKQYRIDRIHLNKKGFSLLKALLDINIFNT